MRVHIIFEGELFLQQFIGELSGKYIFFSECEFF